MDSLKCFVWFYENIIKIFLVLLNANKIFIRVWYVSLPFLFSAANFSNGALSQTSKSFKSDAYS